MCGFAPGFMVERPDDHAGVVPPRPPTFQDVVPVGVQVDLVLIGRKTEHRPRVDAHLIDHLDVHLLGEGSETLPGLQAGPVAIHHEVLALKGVAVVRPPLLRIPRAAVNHLRRVGSFRLRGRVGTTRDDSPEQNYAQHDRYRSDAIMRRFLGGTPVTLLGRRSTDRRNWRGHLQRVNHVVRHGR